MLSSAQYHLLVPTDLVENLKFRWSILAECMKSQRARDLVWHACSQDIIFWINVFGWQTNPDNLGEEDGPFICHPFQQEALLNTIRWQIHERRLVIWEKSRKQGGTIMALFKDIWLSLFHTRKKTLLMSHSEAAVEMPGDEDTLFGKMDFIIKHLPSWMQGGLPRTKGIYKFKGTKSQIRGTSTTTRTGVGGRATSVVGDEVSKWQKADAVLGQLKDTGPILAIGTHYGVGGKWYEMCRDPLNKKIVLHWSMNPMYNRGMYRSDPSLKPTQRVVDPVNNPLPADYPMITDGTPTGGPFPGLRSIYYDELCRDRPSREIAMHWDIDPAGASRQVFSQNLIRNLIQRYSRPPDWEGDILHDPVGRFLGLKAQPNGPLRLWIKPLLNAENTGKWFQPSIYKVGGDIGAGTGATPSCLAAGDPLNGHKVLEYQFATPPQALPANFARIAAAVCDMLKDSLGNNAQMVWDRTGPTGDTFGKALVEIGFRHFWYWRDQFVLNQKISDTPGWFATPASKKLLFEEYEEALREGKLVNPSENALRETLAFEYAKGGSIEHGESLRTEDPTAGRLNHSDMAYADGLMWMLMKEAGANDPGSIHEEEQAATNDGSGIPFTWLEKYYSGPRHTNPFRK